MDDSAQMMMQNISTYFHQLCHDVIVVYGRAYHNIGPTSTQLAYIESRYKEAGFLGSVGCIDCCKKMEKLRLSTEGTVWQLRKRKNGYCSG